MHHLLVRDPTMGIFLRPAISVRTSATQVTNNLPKASGYQAKIVAGLRAERSTLQFFVDDHGGKSFTSYQGRPAS